MLCLLKATVYGAFKERQNLSLLNEHLTDHAENVRSLMKVDYLDCKSAQHKKRHGTFLTTGRVLPLLRLNK